MPVRVTLGGDAPAPLEFDPDAHRYSAGGVAVPGVTTILEPYSGLQWVDPSVLAAAAELGSHVHKACELHDEERLDWASLDPVLEPYVKGWTTFLEDTGAVVIHSERKVFSRRHGYAGTLDRIVAWGRTNRQVDIKTGTAMPKTVGPQTAAYSEAWHEETGERLRDRYCVRLKPDGTYTIKKLEDPRDWQVFKAALTLHRWQHG